MPRFFARLHLISYTLIAILPATAVAQRVTHPGSKSDTSSAAPAADSLAFDDSVVTHHTAMIGGKEIPYDAIAGHIVLTDSAGHNAAKMFYTAYLRTDIRDEAHRPITFAYNGGPGSAATLVQVGAFGPRHIVTADTVALLPPYTIADNQYSILDKTDLVFIDPVGTGYSYLIASGNGKDFWGVDQDARSIAQFVHRYLNGVERWNSPKYLAGESYGTTRSAVLADYLHKFQNTDLNGLILVSCYFDMDQASDNEDALSIPSYAAIAWYHHVAADHPAALEPLLKEVEQFAVTDYTTALLLGASITPAQRAGILDKLERYTGISKQFWDEHNLRVNADQFESELLRSHGLIIGRFDARFAGPPVPGLVGGNAYDPGYNIVNPVIESGYRQYLLTELQYKPHRLPNPGIGTWDYNHVDPRDRPSTNVIGDLGEILIRNRRLQVLINSGLYDLATPYFSTHSAVEHLNIPATALARVHEKTYKAGHMMYVNPASLVELKQNIATFIDETSGP